MLIRKKVKKLISCMLCMAVWFSGFSAYTGEADASAFEGSLAATQSRNAVYAQGGTIKWSASTNKVYKIVREDSNGNSTVVKSLVGMTSKTIKVLPVAPYGSDKEFLRKWMGNSNQGTFTVNGITFEIEKGVFLLDGGAFNDNYDYYLKDGNGNYKVDVVFFGAWDTNGGADLSNGARDAIRKFYEAGGGVIFGHDTIAWGAGASQYDDVSNFWKLADILNMGYDTKYEQAYAKEAGTYKYTNLSSRIQKTKEGLLTQFPYEINQSDITIAQSHNVGQKLYSTGDRWFKFTSTNYSSGSEATNFYLTTRTGKGNAAMVQCGHQGSNITDSEKKIITNLIYYCSQNLKSNSSFTDNTELTDITSPDNPTVLAEYEDTNGGTIMLKFDSQDNGTLYTYKVYEFSKDKDINDLSNGKLKTTVYRESEASGILAYYYKFDDDTNYTNDGTYSNSYNFQALEPGKTIAFPQGAKYLHVYCGDKNGNGSPNVITVGRDTTTPILSKNGVKLNENSEELSEEDLSDLTVEDPNPTSTFWNKSVEMDASGIYGYGLSESKDQEPSEYKKELSEVNLKQFGAGTRWIWVKDYAGNTTRTPIHIKSDLYFTTYVNGERVDHEVYKVYYRKANDTEFQEMAGGEFKSVEIEKYYHTDKNGNSDRIFF